jgi:hypothetical protein
MSIGLLPQGTQELLRSHRHVRQDLVTGYWREVLDEPPGQRKLGRQTQGVAEVAITAVPEAAHRAATTESIATASGPPRSMSSTTISRGPAEAR